MSLGVWHISLLRTCPAQFHPGPRQALSVVAEVHAKGNFDALARTLPAAKFCRLFSVVARKPPWNRFVAGHCCSTVDVPSSQTAEAHT